MLFGLLRSGPRRQGLFGFRPLAVLVSLATTVLAALPVVRRWVAERRRERLLPRFDAAGRFPLSHRSITKTRDEAPPVAPVTVACQGSAKTHRETPGPALALRF